MKALFRKTVSYAISCRTRVAKLALDTMVLARKKQIQPPGRCAEPPEQILSIRHDYSGQDLLGRAADWNAVVLPRHLRYKLGGCAFIHGNKAIAFYFALYSTVRRA